MKKATILLLVLIFAGSADATETKDNTDTTPSAGVVLKCSQVLTDVMAGVIADQQCQYWTGATGFGYKNDPKCMAKLGKTLSRLVNRSTNKCELVSQTTYFGQLERTQTMIQEASYSLAKGLGFRDAGGLAQIIAIKAGTAFRESALKLSSIIRRANRGKAVLDNETLSATAALPLAELLDEVEEIALKNNNEIDPKVWDFAQKVFEFYIHSAFAELIKSTGLGLEYIPPVID